MNVPPRTMCSYTDPYLFRYLQAPLCQSPLAYLSRLRLNYLCIIVLMHSLISLSILLTRNRRRLKDTKYTTDQKAVH